MDCNEPANSAVQRIQPANANGHTIDVRGGSEQMTILWTTRLSTKLAEGKPLCRLPILRRFCRLVSGLLALQVHLT
jgi:hypothetical protein